LERELCAEQSEVAISRVSDSVLKLVYSAMKDGERRIDFRVVLELRLENNELHLRPEVENRTENNLLREFQLILGNVRLRPQTELFWSQLGGTRHRDIPAFVQSGFTAYMASDNKAIEQSVLYPGHASTNSYVIAEERNSLYFGSHDDSFQNTLHLLRKRGTEIDLGMVKYPYLHPGGTVSYPDFVLAPCSGGWHAGARIYRAWADHWYKPRKAADSIRNSNGWQRLIMRHQYGELLFRYSDMPEILRAGLKGDIDTLFLFGWFREGHDAGYPEYHYDETQGGKEVLKQRIAEFQANGGKVILYYNGQLIDKSTEYYRTTGHRICVKNQSGSEHLEYYRFGGSGTALRCYGNKAFVTACPACPEWLEHLKELADRAIELGCAGVFFDQLGFTSVACFDPRHGHPVPLMNPMGAKREMMRKLYEHVKGRAPEMSLGIEWLSDPTFQYADFVHNISGACQAENSDWKQKGEKPFYGVFPEWNRYIFPEVFTTDRDIRDDTDIPRRVNMNLVRGLRSDVEIYRCREILNETPVYQEYLARAGRLRDKYRDLILNGRFLDHDNVQCDNPELFYSVFSHGTKLAVVLTQPHLKQTSATVHVPGYRFSEADGLNGFQVESENGFVTLLLEKNGLAVLVFEQEA